MGKPPPRTCTAGAGTAPGFRASRAPPVGAPPVGAPCHSRDRPVCHLYFCKVCGRCPPCHVSCTLRGCAVRPCAHTDVLGYSSCNECVPRYRHPRVLTGPQRGRWGCGSSRTTPSQRWGLTWTLGGQGPSVWAPGAAVPRPAQLWPPPPHDALLPPPAAALPVSTCPCEDPVMFHEGPPSSLLQNASKETLMEDFKSPSALCMMGSGR